MEEDSENEMEIENDFLTSKDSISLSKINETMIKKKKKEEPTNNATTSTSNSTTDLEGYEKYMSNDLNNSFSQNNSNDSLVSNVNPWIRSDSFINKNESNDKNEISENNNNNFFKLNNFDNFFNFAENFKQNHHLNEQKVLKSSVKDEFKSVSLSEENKEIDIFTGKVNLIQFESNVLNLNNNSPVFSKQISDEDVDKYMSVSISGNILSGSSSDFTSGNDKLSSAEVNYKKKKKSFFNFYFNSFLKFFFPFISNIFIPKLPAGTLLANTGIQDSTALFLEKNRFSSENNLKEKESIDDFNFLKPTVSLSEDIKQVKDHFFEKKEFPSRKKILSIRKLRNKDSEEVDEPLDFHCFNDRFQVAIEKMRSTKKAKISVASDLLINVAQDFLWSAKTYGKIIISEFCLPDNYKTIKPYKGNKGRLGGMKYFHQGKIFFFVFILFFILFFLLLFYFIFYFLKRNFFQTC